MLERFETVLGDTLEDVTGHRSIPCSTEGRKSPLEQTSEGVAQIIVESRDDLIKESELAYSSIIDHKVLVMGYQAFDQCASLIRKKIESVLSATVPNVDQITRFTDNAAETVMFITYRVITELGYGVVPDLLGQKKELVQKTVQLMSRFPTAMSVDVKNIFTISLMDPSKMLFDGDDISEECERLLRRKFKARKKHKSFINSLNQLKKCPASEKLEEFTGVLFDMYLAMYRKVHNSFSCNGEVPEQLIHKAKQEVIPVHQAVLMNIFFN